MKSGDEHDSAFPRTPTIIDIAKQAKVSRATVSYVLNNTPNARVGLGTRERVLTAAAELGYIPHSFARSLRAGRSNLILLPIPTLYENYIENILLSELSEALKQLGYMVLIHPERHLHEQDLVTTWASLRPIGVFMESKLCTPRVVDTLRSVGTRGILLTGSTPSVLAPTLLRDQVHIGRLVSQHLLERGYRHIGVIVPPGDGQDDRSRLHRENGLDRLQGIRQVAQVHEAVVEAIDLPCDEEAINALVTQWQGRTWPRALFTYSDDYAIMLMSALLDRGFRIPEDIALIGSDDLHICTLLRPQLSSIRFDYSFSTTRVAAFFHAIIQGEIEGNPSIPQYAPKIIARTSS